MSRFPKSAWLVSGCLVSLSLASAAFAQSAQPAAPAAADGEAIVVTGIRASIGNALEVKRMDSRVLDGISSEDLGKFPSENITEAIQRIPGVQMSNINGRGATISIRGLGPQYALTTVNGQTMKSADFTDGFRYDIIQTELANAIQVIKSPTADMDAGGLSGTVNIETIKPLSYHSRQLVLTAKAQNSSYAGGKITPKISGSYVDQLADGTLGVYLNLGYQKLKDRADYFWMDRWTTQTIAGSPVLVPRRPRYRRIDRDTERLMASGGFQWKPSDSLEIDGSAIYARDKTQYDLNQQVFLFSTDATQLIANKVVNGTSVNTTATNFTMENNRQHEDRNLVTQDYMLSAKWTGENGWTVRGVANYTKGTTYWREAAAILGVTIPTATIDLSDPKAVSYTVGTSLTNPALYAPATLTRNEYPNGATRQMKSSERSAQVDIGKDLDLGLLKHISVGAKYRHEFFNRYITRHDMVALASPPAASSPIFPAMATTNYGVSGFLNSSSNIPNAWIGPVLTAYDSALAAAGIVVPDLFAPEGSYKVDRHMSSAYLMGNIDTTIGGMPLRGNIGVRYEHTKEKVRGNITAPLTGNYTDVQADIGDYVKEQSYNNVLPSLNLVLEPAHNVQVRFAAAKVLVRPIMDANTSMAQTTSQATSGGLTTVSVDLGQAGLKPLTANQLDLGVEWYLDRSSAISINGFYKWIKNGTFSGLICPASFNSISLTANANGDCMGTDGKAYQITQTLNDPNTIKVKGFEIAWTQSFDRFLPIKGFGIISNFTRVYPQKLAIGTGYTIRNLSKVTWNVTPYWENEHFNIRASINHRSEYEQNSADSFFAREGHVVRGRTQIDLSGGYSPNDHLSFTAGVINLNNSREEAYKGDPSVWQESSFFGRSYFVSATLKM